MSRLWPFVVVVLLVTVGAVAGQQPDETPTLLVFSSIERLYAGTLTPTLPLADAQAAVSEYPPEWAVVGLATTNLAQRNGEIIVDGTVSEPRYWWVDPGSPNLATLYELNATGQETDESASPGVIDDPEHEFPFFAVSLADAETAITFEGEDIDNLHLWLIAQLEAAEIALAGVHVTGEFDSIRTSIAHDIPPTGFFLVDGRVSETIFHYVDYDEPGDWTLEGVYAAGPDAQAIISVVGVPLHLHGYDLENSIGGHIQGAAASRVTATVYPLETIVQTLEDDAE